MRRFWSYLLALAPLIAGSALLVAEPVAARDATAGGDLYSSSCASCHSIGGGKLVGPDLRGVLERREKAWVEGHIKAPSAQREQKDETALANVEEYGAAMPDLGLTDEQVQDLVAYLETATGTPIPKPYYPTLALGALGVLGLTFAGLKAGSKKVDIRS